MQDSKTNRRVVLQSAQKVYERYILLLDAYRLLSKSEMELLERYLEDRDGFSLISSSDFTARRDAKIARFKQEKELKLKLEVRRDYQLLSLF